MNKNESIEINMVANGFMVRPGFTQPGERMDVSEFYAFNSINDLSAWLFEHFDNHHAGPNDKGGK